MSQLQKFEKDLQMAKSPKELFSIQSVQERFINNYKATTGREDGMNRFEQEKFAFLSMIAERPELQKLENFAYFGVLTFVGASGLSLRDNKVYVMPNGKGGLKVQPSPSGRREMMEMMPNVKSVPEAVLVMKGDKFVHDKLNNRVAEHLTTDKSVSEIKLENIVAAYQRIIYKDKTVVDVVVYHDDLVKAKSKSKMQSDAGFWAQWPGEACKKVPTNRAFRIYHKYPANAVLLADVENDDAAASETDEEYIPYAESETVETNVGTVATDTGEVIIEKVKKEDTESFI